MPEAARPSRFKELLASGRPLLGTFVKTAAVQPVEILGSVGFSFIVVDQEHAPLGRDAVDLLLLAARASGLPALVRVADLREIGHALDGGADGVVVPHVASASDAVAAVAACRYAGGARGFSNSPRAGGYGAVGLPEHVRRQDGAVTVVLMIEDPAGVVQADAILATEGVDAVLIGCADLAVALGEAAADAGPVRQAARQIAAAATASGRAVIAPAPSLDGARWLQELGVRSFVVGTDQAFLRAGATAALRAFSDAGGRSLERAA